MDPEDTFRTQIPNFQKKINQTSEDIRIQNPKRFEKQNLEKFAKKNPEDVEILKPKIIVLSISLLLSNTRIHKSNSDRFEPPVVTIIDAVGYGLLTFAYYCLALASKEKEKGKLQNRVEIQKTFVSSE
ncbi:hypothetical protein GCK72_009012 [Caenorhabditis remanei]|uniref:Uncharacterized protein n=1 Tax=Caenorhabditis remanei TaxID=31234 RepID=A0A6A5H2Q4_CAERE|nr:hypothetical protein GCK72_009012 [Caenorhabditis remanei]KAF1760762.1 hypothetical protein GCK72_009012 [Caenorhabditis remanei]